MHIACDTTLTGHKPLVVFFFPKHLPNRFSSCAADMYFHLVLSAISKQAFLWLVKPQVFCCPRMILWPLREREWPAGYKLGSGTFILVQMESWPVYIQLVQCMVQEYFWAGLEMFSRHQLLARNTYMTGRGSPWASYRFNSLLRVNPLLFPAVDWSRMLRFLLDHCPRPCFCSTWIPSCWLVSDKT